MPGLVIESSREVNQPSSGIFTKLPQLLQQVHHRIGHRHGMPAAV